MSETKIPDARLDTIITPGKVSGAALTGLASTPAGAGKYPFANVSDQEFTIGETLVIASDGEVSLSVADWTLKKQFTLGHKGALRIRFQLRRAGNDHYIYGGVCRNGAFVGGQEYTSSLDWVEFYQDFAGWTAGDLCQFWLYATSGSTAYGRYFRLYSASALRTFEG